MRAFARWVSERPHRPVIVCAAAAPAAFIPLLGQALVVISGATLGLVALREGPLAALRVALLASAVLAGAALLSGINVWLFLLPVAIAWPASLGLASVLRSTGSLSMVVQVAVLGTMALVALWYLAGDPAGYWREQLLAMREMIAAAEAQGQQLGLMAQMPAIIEQQIDAVTGMVALGLLLWVLCTLFVARYWHATLDRPGGFGEEFRQLRAGLVVTIIASLVFVLGFGGWVLVSNLAIVATGGFLLQGVALVHFFVRRNGWPPPLLTAFYAALVLLQGMLAPPLIAAGFVDNWIDFRRRFPADGAAS